MGKVGHRAVIWCGRTHVDEQARSVSRFAGFLSD
jgi:hypothetical protein